MPPPLDETESVAVIIVDDSEERQTPDSSVSVAVGNGVGNFRASSSV